MHEKQTYSYSSQLSTILILASIFFVFFNQFIGFWTPESAYKQEENRNKQTLPKLDPARLDKFPPLMDAFINDQLNIRPWLLDNYHELKYVLGVSPNPEKVLVGNGQWLYLGMRDQEYVENKIVFSKAQIDSLRYIWKSRFDFLDKKGILNHVVIVPVKQRVYPEFLPTSIRNVYPNYSLELLKKLKFPTKKIAYLLPELITEKQKYPVFYQLDNHWNSAGGYVAYRKIMEVLKQQKPSLKTLSESEISYSKVSRNSGMLSVFLGLDGKFTETFTEVSTQKNSAVEVEKYGFEIPEYFPYKEVFERRFVNLKAKNKEKILIISDSFGEATQTFFKETFEECLFLFDGWQYKLDTEILEIFKPDIVVFITVEPFVGHVLNYDFDVH
jgi:alginate O-acetyltransferase complex protein AlgJ